MKYFKCVRELLCNVQEGDFDKSQKHLDEIKALGFIPSEYAKMKIEYDLLETEVALMEFGGKGSVPFNELSGLDQTLYDNQLDNMKGYLYYLGTRIERYKGLQQNRENE